jgi:hypothetical protein
MPRGFTKKREASFRMSLCCRRPQAYTGTPDALSGMMFSGATACFTKPLSFFFYCNILSGAK